VLLKPKLTVAYFTPEKALPKVKATFLLLQTMFFCVLSKVKNGVMRGRRKDLDG